MTTAGDPMNSKGTHGGTLLRVAAVLFGLFGVAYVAIPVTLIRPMGISATPSGLTDIRATYGGLQIGMAIFFFWAAASPERRQAGLLFLFLVCASVALSRAIGVLIDRDMLIQLVGFLFEIPLALCAATMLRRNAQPVMQRAGLQLAADRPGDR